MNPDEVPSRADQSREAILQAALKLFIDQGYHGTSMRQIAAQAGIALGGIYNHFANKEDIFRTLFDELHPYRDVLPSLLEAQGETMEEIIRDAASRIRDSLHRRPDFLKLTFIELLEFQSKHIPELFLKIYPLLLGIIQRIQANHSNELRDIPPPMLIRSFIGMFVAYALTDMLFGEHQTLPPEMRTGAMETFVDIYLHGILARGEE